MYKIIGGDPREYGPVSAAELHRWIAEGRVNAQSSVRAENAADWRPLSAFEEFAAVLRAQSDPASLTDLSAPAIDVAAWTKQLLAREIDVPVGRCLARSFKLLQGNFGLLFGAAGLVWLIGTVCEFIPILGMLAYWILRGVFFGGLYLVFLKRIRGQASTVGDVFAGFRRNPAQLLLAGFVSLVLGFIASFFCILPGFYLLVAWIFAVPLVADKRLEFWSAMELSRKVVTRVWFEVLGLLLVAFLPTLLATGYVGFQVFSVIFSTAQDFLARPDFARALTLAHEMARMMTQSVLLARLVLLLNLPFAIGALMYAYEDLFGPRPAATP